MTKQMKQVMDILDEWKPKLELEHWDITVQVIEEDQPVHMGNVGGEIEPNFLYQSAIMRIYPICFKQEEDLEETVVHELCHCLTQGYKDLFDKYVFKDKHITIDQEAEVNERLTNWITRLVIETNKRRNK